MTIKKLIPILLLTLVNMLGFTVLIPVYPAIADYYNHGDIVYGLLVSIYSIFQFFGAPIMGLLSDRYGRKKVLFYSQLGTLISWIVFGLAYFVPNVWVFGTSLPIYIILLSRMLDGITGGNISVTNAYVSDITPVEKRTTIFGYMSSILAVAILIGPLLGIYSSIGRFGYLGTVIIQIILSLVTLVMIETNITESLPENKRIKSIKFSQILKELNLWTKIRKYKKNLNLMKIFELRFYFSIILASVGPLLIIELENTFGIDQQHLLGPLVLTGFIFMLNFVLLLIFIMDKVSDWFLITIGFVITGISLFGISFTTDREKLYLFALVAYILSIGMSIIMPAIKSIISKNTDDESQGDVMGIDEGLNALCTGIGPLVFTILYTVYPALSFVGLGLVMLLGLVVVKLRY